jgi:hypothetical protein
MVPSMYGSVVIRAGWMPGGVCGMKVAEVPFRAVAVAVPEEAEAVPVVPVIPVPPSVLEPPPLPGRGGRRP